MARTTPWWEPAGRSCRAPIRATGVHVHDYAFIEDSVILPNVDLGRHVVLKRVVVNRRYRIPEYFRVGIDPVEDRKRFDVSPGCVMVITTTMLVPLVNRTVRAESALT